MKLFILYNFHIEVTLKLRQNSSMKMMRVCLFSLFWHLKNQLMKIFLLIKMSSPKLHSGPLKILQPARLLKGKSY